MSKNKKNEVNYLKSTQKIGGSVYKISTLVHIHIILNLGVSPLTSFPVAWIKKLS